ncbi:MAG TPA: orotidine-5'-phosphate decarboxylase [Firmicutes bacterium]|nr:orotidine-5'-phosphate decarboxylase [Candidatus Fermentithermobacillaceae bacterium]
MHFADRLHERISDIDSRLVIGIDPYPEKLFGSSSPFARAYPHLSPEKLLIEFCAILIETAEETACAVKPQAAFFESMGLSGLAVLSACLKAARMRGIPVIMDAKRGDIGSTAAAYARAYLDPDSDFFADALTVNPYLGPDTLEPFARAAAQSGSGIFVLVKTSNPGSGAFQDRLLKESAERLYTKVARAVTDLGAANIGRYGYSHVGAVVGATYPSELKALREVLSSSYLLVPGYGAQGGTAHDVIPAFRPDGMGAIVNASRSIDYAYEALGNGIDKDSIRKAIYDAAKKAQMDLNNAAKPIPST